MRWALIAGVLSGVAVLVRMLIPRAATGEPEVGAVSEGWLASERGRGRGHDHHG